MILSTLFVDLLLYFFLLQNIKVPHHDFYFYPRLQLHRKPIVPYDNLLKPPPSKALVKLGNLGILLLNELVQFVGTLLLVTDSDVFVVLPAGRTFPYMPN